MGVNDLKLIILPVAGDLSYVYRLITMVVVGYWLALTIRCRVIGKCCGGPISQVTHRVTLVTQLALRVLHVTRPYVVEPAR